MAVGLLESSRRPRAGSGGSPGAGTGPAKYEYPFHVSPTGNQHDAIAAVELALAEYEAIFGHLCGIYARSMRRPGTSCRWSPSSPTTAVRSGRPYFQIFIASHPELRHVRTRKNSPGQNGARERGFGTLEYERLFLDDIPDALPLAERAENNRIAGSKLPLRSLGTSIVPCPTSSVRTVSVRVPFRALPELLPSTACLSYPRWSFISSSRAVSKTVLVRYSHTAHQDQ